MEINAEARNQGIDFGVANAITSEKCRFRWSYLHLQRKLGKQIVYKVYASASESENKENNDSYNRQNDGSRISQLKKA